MVQDFSQDFLLSGKSLGHTNLLIWGLGFVPSPEVGTERNYQKLFGNFCQVRKWIKNEHKSHESYEWG